MPSVEYRAGLMKDVLRALPDELDEALAAAIVDALGETTRASIEDAPRTGWLDAELMIEIDEAIVSVVGMEEFEAFWFRFGSAATRIPIVRPLAEGAVRMLGTPKGMLKTLVMAYRHMTKNLGTFSLEFPAKNHGVLRIDDMQISSVELFARSNRATTAGALTLLRTECTIEVEYAQGPPGWIQFDTRW